MHMLLTNLTAIYQGNIHILKHTQESAHALSRLCLRYTLTGELDTRIENIIKELRTKTVRVEPPPSAQPTATHPNSDATTNNMTTTTDHKHANPQHPHPQTNYTHNLHVNNTHPPRSTLKPPLPRPTRRTQSLKRTKRLPAHMDNSQLHINQCKE